MIDRIEPGKEIPQSPKDVFNAAKKLAQQEEGEQRGGSVHSRFRGVYVAESRRFSVSHVENNNGELVNIYEFGRGLRVSIVHKRNSGDYLPMEGQLKGMGEILVNLEPDTEVMGEDRKS